MATSTPDGRRQFCDKTDSRFSCKVQKHVFFCSAALCILWGVGTESLLGAERMPSHPSQPTFPTYPTNPYRGGWGENTHPKYNPTNDILGTVLPLIPQLLTPQPNNNGWQNNNNNNTYYRPNNNQPNYTQPTYTQPTYTQPTYTQPQVNVPRNIIPTNSVPTNQVPTNTLPPKKEIPAPGNYSLNGIAPLQGGTLNLTQDQADQASAQLEGQMQQKLQRFETEEQNLQSGMDQFKAEANAKLPPAEAAKVSNAIDNRDPDALRQVMIANGADPKVADMAAADLNTMKQIENLKSTIQNGGSAVDIAQASSQVLQAQQGSIITHSALGSPPISAAQAAAILQQDQNAMNDIVALKAGEEAIQASVQGTLNVPGGTLPLPTGSIIAGWVPWLDPGTTAAVGQNMVLLGTGEGGALTCGYVTPAEAGLPIVPGPVVSSKPGASPAIVIENPEANQASISYLMNNDVKTLAPGKSQEIPSGHWTIKFDRGGGNGQASYSLEPGYYEFAVGNQGWELNSKEVQVTIDNSANPYDFNFLLNDETQSIPARDIIDITSATQVQIRFDGGNGQTKQKTLKPGIYSVGVLPNTNQLDLFEGSALPEQQAEVVQMPDLSIDTTKIRFAGKGRRPLSTASTNGIALRKTDLPAPKTVQPPKRLVNPRPVNLSATAPGFSSQDFQQSPADILLELPSTETKPGELYENYLIK